MSIATLDWITNSCGTAHTMIRTCNNEVTFNGQINAKNITNLIKVFDDCIIEIKKTNTASMSSKSDSINIILYIDSYGGTLKDCYKFIDYINIIKRLHKVKLTTVGMGVIASAATLIHSVGDERLITANTEIMIHELYTGMQGKYTECLSYIKSITDTHEKLIKIYLDTNKKNISRETLEILLRKESWFTADEYIELGFADSIYA